GVAAVAVDGVAVVALLVTIDHAVAHRLDAAVRRAAVAALRVAVVALLAGIEPAISAARRGGRSLRGAGTVGDRPAAAAGEKRAARRRAGDVAVTHLAGIDDAVPAHGAGRQRRGGRRRRLGSDELDGRPLEAHVGGGEAAREAGARARP